MKAFGVQDLGGRIAEILQVRCWLRVSQRLAVGFMTCRAEILQLEYSNDWCKVGFQKAIHWWTWGYVKLYEV